MTIKQQQPFKSFLSRVVSNPCMDGYLVSKAYMITFRCEDNGFFIKTSEEHDIYVSRMWRLRSDNVGFFLCPVITFEGQESGPALIQTRKILFPDNPEYWNDKR